MCVEDLHQQIKAFIKENKIHVVLAKQVQSPYVHCPANLLPDTDILFVDYLNMLAPAGEKHAKV